MSDTQIAPDQAGGPKPVNVGDEEFKDEDVEIPAEEGAEPAPAEQKAEEEPAPEKKRRGPKRYAALTHERDEARGYAAQLQEELARERARAAELEVKANESANVAMQSFAAKAESDLKEARAFHSQAIESGESAKITEAAERLASAKATMDDVEAWKKSEKAKPAEVAKPAETEKPKPFQDLPEPIKDWAVENRYWDQNARDDEGNIILDRGGRPTKNPDFDEEMHVEATMYATKLERKIASGKATFKVASPEYFREIDKHMRVEFPDYFGGEEEAEDEPEKVPARKPSPVAAPTRSALPGVSKPGTKVPLKAEEIRFHRKMWENGGGGNYPEGHPKAFRPMTYEDSKVSFARQKQTQAKNQ